MSISNKHVGMNIAKLRAERNMTQQQLAAVLNVSHQAVSKWENGIALPDLETLLNLSRLFGVTVEQLLANSEAEKENDTFDPQIVLDGLKEATSQTVQTFKGIGNMLFKKVGNLIDSVSAARDDEASAFEDDGTSESTAVDTAASEQTSAEKEDINSERSEGSQADERCLSLGALLQLAPFMSRQKVSDMLLTCINESGAAVPAETLLSFAPFITRETLLLLLIKQAYEDISPDMIVSFAPYLNQDMLFRLIIKNADRMDLKYIKKIAPFLKNSMVDLLVDMACGIKNAINYETISNAAQKVSKSVEGFAKNIAEDIKNACQNDNSAIQPATASDEKATEQATEKENAKENESNFTDKEEALSAVDTRMYKALEDRSWDWIRLNIPNVNSGKLLEKVVITAVADLNEEEARDILLNAAPYMDADAFSKVIENLCDNGHWERVCDLDPLVDAETAGMILLKAASGGRKALKAVRLYASRAPRNVWNDVSRGAIDNSDWELVNALTENIQSR